jgi:L-threonylcarbamoyladenylate synthase
MLRQMRTAVRKISPENENAALCEAADVLRRGGLVAFPTETVYGLGADALNALAVEKIFAAKRRPKWDPLIVHIATWTMLEQVAYEVSERARLLMAAFWPGPLTLLLPRGDRIADVVTASRPLVAVRWPAHPLARALIAAADTPIAAPSANLFNHVSPTSAQHVLADLDGRIDMVLDGGVTDLGLESCVMDPNANPPLVYRPGSIRRAELENVVGPVRFFRAGCDDASQRESEPSPGTTSRHYAPRARVILVNSQAELEQAGRDGNFRAGVMLPDNWTAPPSATIFNWGRFDDAAQLGHNLYAGLRWLDEQSVDVIFCPLPPELDTTRALRDRLLKAAG